MWRRGAESPFRIMMFGIARWLRGERVKEANSEAIVISEQGVPVDRAARSSAACPFAVFLAYLRSFMLKPSSPLNQSKGSKQERPHCGAGQPCSPYPPYDTRSVAEISKRGRAFGIFFFDCRLTECEKTWCLLERRSSEAKVRWFEIGYQFVNGGMCVLVIYDHTTANAVQEEFTTL